MNAPTEMLGNHALGNRMMDEQIVTVRRDGIDFGLSRALSREQLDEVIQLLRKPPRHEPRPLGGRSAVTRAEISGVGRVVVKYYTRGGLLRHLISRRYVRSGATRGEVEFRLLQRARALGIRAPEPIAFADEGRFLYRAWLVMREIEDGVSLVEICRRSDDEVGRVMGEAAAAVARLVEERIFHVDLHPGNVYIDGRGLVYLLDFDKACEFRGTRNELRDLYLRRWRRAVIKHHLPESVSELLCARLRENFDRSANQTCPLT